MVERYFLTPDRNCYSINSGIPIGPSDQEMPFISAFAESVMEALGDGVQMSLFNLHAQCSQQAGAHPLFNPSFGV